LAAYTRPTAAAFRYIPDKDEMEKLIKLKTLEEAQSRKNSISFVSCAARKTIYMSKLY